MTSVLRNGSGLAGEDALLEVRDLPSGRDPMTEAPAEGLAAKLVRVARQELSGISPRLQLARLIAGLLPDETAGRLRTALLRLGGLQIGRGTIFNGAPSFAGGSKVSRLLHIGEDCWFNVGCRFDVHAEVRIGSRVRFGQEVMLLTHTHRIGRPPQRAGELRALPMVIEDGAWIGARAVLMPGVRVGRGAIVAAGAVVIRDVEPDTIVGGVPAQPITHISDEV